jgi:hypothetical protein
MGKQKYDAMCSTFREMSRAADNAAQVDRRGFVKLVKKFERAYSAWRDLIPEFHRGPLAPRTTKIGGGENAAAAR